MQERIYWQVTFICYSGPQGWIQGSWEVMALSKGIYSYSKEWCLEIFRMKRTIKAPKIPALDPPLMLPNHRAADRCQSVDQLVPGRARNVFPMCHVNHIDRT